jgi:UDPglucose 6-dehydrogenase
VHAFDPTVHVDELNGITVMQDPYAVCEGADVLAVLTEWDEFRWFDVDKVASVIKAKHVVDARNLLDRAAYVRAGFTYQGIGRP